MIEIIYNKEKEKAVGNEEYFCVPRNIRQMGDVPKENKIYMEDYVYTYLTSDWKEEDVKGRIAILLGKYNWKNGISYTFIKSAVTVEGITVTRDNYPLNDTVWGTVYEEMKTYFPGQEVVGWYLSVPDGGNQVTDVTIRTHLKHFGGNDKVLLLADPYERESSFYLYKNNQMEKMTGYYIFYEKNDMMQEYMLAKKTETEGDYTGKIQDRAVQDFRKIIARKQEERSDKKSGLSWTVAACMGIAAVSLGVSAFWLTREKSTGGDTEILSAEETSSIMEDLLIEESDTEEPEMVLLTPEATETPGTADTPGTTETPGETDTPETEEISGTSEETVVSEVASTSETSKTTQSQETSSSGTETGLPVENESSDTTEETAISVYTKYTVRDGDTISKISMRYYGDFSKITEICKINNLLEEDVIYPGQTILLP